MSGKTNNRRRCSNCGCEHLPVLYTRHFKKKTRRVRQCRACGKRMTTWETEAVGNPSTQTEGK